MLAGYAYPLTIDPKTNGLLLASGAEYIQQQIESYVFTERAERLGLPGYGMKNTLFNSVQNAGFIANDLQRGLSAAIPQSTFKVAGEVNDLGELFLSVGWTYQDDEQEPLTFVLTDAGI